MSSQISRRQAIGGALSCLMTPFVPKMRETKPTPDKHKFFYVTSTIEGEAVLLSPSPVWEARVFREDTVAHAVLTFLCETGGHSEHHTNFPILQFLWDRHEHEISRRIF